MRRFLAKSMLLGTLVLAVQLVLGPGTIPGQLEEFDAGVRHGARILFLADSTNRFCGPHDDDRRPISGMLQGLLPQWPVLTIDHPAYHMGNYLSYCRALVQQRGRISKVVIPVNMRSFSVGWDKRPEWQFVRERALLDHSRIRMLYWPLFKPLTVFKVVNVNPISEEEFRALPVFLGRERFGTAGEFLSASARSGTDSAIRRQLVFRYLYALEPGHEKVKAMLQIPRLLLPRGLEPVFYVVPVDVATGEQHLPGTFTAQLRANVGLVLSLLRKEGLDPLDLSESLPASRFVWVGDPNEHLDQDGRRYVAERLARRVERGANRDQSRER